MALGIPSSDNFKTLTMNCEFLAQWFDQNGWVGYDPYDVLGVPPFLGLLKYKYPRFACHKINEFLPHLLRRAFKLTKTINPKAVALLALAYQNLFRLTHSAHWAMRSKACLNWLEKNSSAGYSAYCWGYPFHWQSRAFIPRDTPSSVVTAICSDAFLNGYELFHIDKYLRIAESCAQFFLEDLQADILDNQSLCFSYTPIDNLHVHNANLWVAYALCAIGATTENSSLVNTAMQAVHYSLNGQEADGSWDYFGPPDVSEKKYVDVYHTGFVLRCLYRIYQIVEEPIIFEAVKKGYRFFLHNLLVEGRIPKFRRNRKNPVDIHSCSEAILCLAELYDDFPEGPDIATAIALWTIDNMSDAHGQFYYRKYSLYTLKMPYIRWGQAWMFLALSRLLHLLNVSKEIKTTIKI